jgi:hypothetical protein
MGEWVETIWPVGIGGTLSCRCGEILFKWNDFAMTHHECAWLQWVFKDHQGREFLYRYSDTEAATTLMIQR